jgi:hypothetical protein
MPGILILASTAGVTGAGSASYGLELWLATAPIVGTVAAVIVLSRRINIKRTAPGSLRQRRASSVSRTIANHHVMHFDLDIQLIVRR